MNCIRNKDILSWIFAFLFCVTMLVTAGNAQTSKLTSISYSPAQSDEIQTFSFTFEGVSFGEALQQVADKGHLKLLVNHSLLPGDYADVSMKLENVNLREAFEQILAGTGLDFMVSGSGYVIIVQELKNQKIRQETVTGTVTDASTGETLPGVNVVIKGTTTGTSTGTNGEYELTVESLQDTLVFSFVGYQTREVPINGRTSIDVALQPQTITGEEVVVVGYGRQSRISTTGAISSVGADNVESTASVSMGEALTGQVAGVVTVSEHGQPGVSDPTMVLRGMGTLNDNEPLIVIDGVPNSIRTFMQLNPADIESISVLKDASSTAVYGVRGANGVVVVETKAGRAGEVNISAEITYGVQMPTYLPDYVGSYEWSLAYNETLQNDGVTEGLIPQSHISHYQKQDEPLLFPDVNWMDETLNNAAVISRNTINISGGSEDVSYFGSVGYLKQDGLITNFADATANTTYDRFSIRANLGVDVTPTTEIEFRSSGRIGIRKRPMLGFNNPLHIFYGNIGQAPPMAAAGIVDGRFIQPDGDLYHSYSENRNPVAPVIGEGFHQFRESRLNLNFDLRQDMEALSPVLRGLEFRTKVGYRGGYDERLVKDGPGFPTYTSLYNMDASNPDPNKPDSAIVFQVSGLPGINSYNYRYQNPSRYFYLDAGLEYERSFRDHTISGLLLYTQNKEYYPNLEYSNIPTGNIGMVGRVVYNYNKQYIIEFNLGYNGSENFAKESRFGLFPSVSGSWIVTKEPFMQNVSFLDQLKLRASYGIVGSDQAANRARFIYIGDEYNRNVNKYYGYNFGNNVPEYKSGVNEESIGNENVTWETARKQNYGVDIELLDNRLDLSADYFYEHRDDILMFRQSAPGYLGIDLPPLNIGEVENEGFEVNMSWEDQVGEFTYRIGGNITRARNTILFMDEITPPEPYQRRTGRSMNTPYGYVFDGFYTEEQVAIIENQIEQDMAPDEREYAIPFAPVKAGDMKYKDLNGDGVIDSRDEKVFGYPQLPQIQGGLNMAFGFKGFDLNLGFQGAAEVSRNMRNVYSDAFGGHNNQGVWSPLYKYRWTPEHAENGTARFPRLTFENDAYNRELSTFWNRDASYLRLKRAELGYTFSQDVLRSLPGIRQLRIYVTGQNLYTFQKEEYKWFDPEKNAQARVSTFYPNLRIITGGLNIKF